MHHDSTACRNRRHYHGAGLRSRASELEAEVDQAALAPVHLAEIEAGSDKADFIANPVRHQRCLGVVEHDAKLAQGLSNATVNRTLELLRAILRKSVNDWEWLERAPQIRMLKEPTRRIRFLTREEAPRLLAALPEHLADMAAFSLATGLRASNVTGLQWTQVDLVRRLAWVHADQAKARRAIPVPLNAEAVLLVRKQLGKHGTHVFSYRGMSITQVSTKAWYAALERAGITDFRWHDLRHTWASWHVQQGTPLFALQELGGWESAEMVRRYAHLAADHLAPFAERLCALRAVDSKIQGRN